MNPLIKKLEEKLLPEFEEIAAKIRQEIHNINVDVYSLPAGSKTVYQGHDFHIDCVLTDALDDETNNIALNIELCHTATVPLISADVTWGNPSCFRETEFYEWEGNFIENGLKVTDKVLEDLYKDLPRFYEALFVALRHRKPPNE